MKEIIEIKKIAEYVKIPNGAFTVGSSDDDFVKDMLTARLYGYVAQMAKEEGEIVVPIERPKFLDWILRRQREKKIKYSIQQLVKIKRLKFPDNVRTIQIEVET